VALARVVSHEVERVLVLAITLSLVTLSLLPQDFWVVWVLAVVVVNLAFFGINQHFMRALQLNKLLWARLAIFVRMKSLCAFSEGTLDLLSIGGALNTQNLVVVPSSSRHVQKENNCKSYCNQKMRSPHRFHHSSLESACTHAHLPMTSRVLREAEGEVTLLLIPSCGFTNRLHFLLANRPCDEVNASVRR